MRLKSFYIPMLLFIGFAAGFIVDFLVLAKNLFFDSCYRVSAFEMFLQVSLSRLISRTMIAMAHWINKVSDKSYILLFDGKKDFTILRNTAFG